MAGPVQTTVAHKDCNHFLSNQYTIDIVYKIQLMDSIQPISAFLQDIRIHSANQLHRPSIHTSAILTTETLGDGRFQH
jgi:hypothetical protein